MKNEKFEIKYGSPSPRCKVHACYRDNKGILKRLCDNREQRWFDNASDVDCKRCFKKMLKEKYG